MYKTTSKNVTRMIALFLSFCLIATAVPSSSFAYTAEELGSKSTVNVIETGTPDGSEYIKLQVTGTEILVTFKHSQAFDRVILRLMKDGSNFRRDVYATIGTGAGETLQQFYNFSGVPDGDYYLRIVTQKAAQGSAGLEEYTTYLQGIPVTVSGGVPSMYQYTTIAKSNQEKTAFSNPENFKDKSMADLKYQLFAKAGTEKDYRAVAASEANYYKQISDDIVAGSTSDYDKLKKIYTYVATNFYYDHYGVANKKPGFDDPYNNLKFVNNGTGNGYNASAGKVAVQCDGYAGVFTALARAQDIPCRLVYGRKITSGTHMWHEETASMEKNNHTWVEAWTDGRWITIDPQQGSYSSYSKDKQWLKTVLVNYTFFDVNSTMFAFTHYAHEVVSGDKTASHLTAKNEVSQLKTFLNVKASGKTNGKRLNKAYKASNTATWGTKTTLVSSGNGRIQKINWPNKKLAGKMNLNNFKDLKYLTIYRNDIKGLTTKGCTALETVYASGNDITTVNLSTSKKLKKADFKSNPLTKAQLYTNKKSVTISKTGKGTFGFKYENKKITIYPKAKPGYKYAGLYANGKRITKKTTYTFKATKKSYVVKFVKK